MNWDEKKYHEKTEWLVKLGVSPNYAIRLAAMEALSFTIPATKQTKVPPSNKIDLEVAR